MSKEELVDCKEEVDGGGVGASIRCSVRITQVGVFELL